MNLLRLPRLLHSLRHPVMKLPRMPRPATMRVRLTLLTGVITLITLAIGAAATATAERASLLQGAQKRTLYWSPGPQDTILPCEEDNDGVVMPKEAALRTLSPLDIQACSLPFNWAETEEECLVTDSGGSIMTYGSLSFVPWTVTAQKPLVMNRKNNACFMLITDPLRVEQARLDTFVCFLGGGTLALTLLVAASTWFAAGRVLRPVEAIRAEFAELSAHHLDRRVPVPQAGNEIARLAVTMNTTLDRLQTAVDRHRQFTADASHELRTPLACLRTELELALNRPHNADWPRVVHNAHEDTLRLQDLTEDLLLLARLDTEQPDRQPQQTVDLTDIVREETARRRPRHPLTLTASTEPGPVAVQGHPTLLARVLGNLLDNAERHATSTVTVRLTHDTEHHEAVLDVLDDGAGVALEDHQRIFERFTRLDDARTRDTGGAGLGLAIAHRITTTYHGTLIPIPSTTGAHFTLRLPTSPP